MSITDTRSLLEELRTSYGPVFEEIGLGTLQRELDDVLPDQEVRRLKERGFGALRVPTRYGGRGASLPALTQLGIPQRVQRPETRRPRRASAPQAYIARLPSRLP